MDDTGLAPIDDLVVLADLLGSTPRRQNLLAIGLEAAKFPPDPETQTVGRREFRTLDDDTIVVVISLDVIRAAEMYIDDDDENGTDYAVAAAVLASVAARVVTTLAGLPPIAQKDAICEVFRGITDGLHLTEQGQAEEMRSAFLEISRSISLEGHCCIKRSRMTGGPTRSTCDARHDRLTRANRVASAALRPVDDSDVTSYGSMQQCP
jgi:hypothetical protein